MDGGDGAMFRIEQKNGDAIGRADPDDVDELVELIERHLTDDDYHRERRDALATYRPPTWEDGADGIEAAFRP